MESITYCEGCGTELTLGSWPFCNGQPESHQMFKGREAQEGTPTIVYKNAEGKVWYPAGDMAKAPVGYEKHELRNTRERDKFEKEINESETAKFRETVHRDRQLWRDTLEQCQDGIRTLENMGPNGRKWADAIKKDMAKKEGEYDSRARGGAGFHIVANHFYGNPQYEE